MKLRNKAHVERIAINLTDSAGLSDGYPLAEDDLKKLKGIYPLVKAYRSVLGDKLSPPILEGNMIHLDVDAIDGITPYSLSLLKEDVDIAATELKRNAALANPLPHGSAVRKPHLVALLRAASSAFSNHKLTSVLETANGRFGLPILESADFTEPELEDALAMTGAWAVVGARRDAINGHRLIVTDNDLFVSVPTNDPKWRWEELVRRVDGKTQLVGKLTRRSKAEPWQVDSASTFSSQAPLQGMEAS